MKKQPDALQVLEDTMNYHEAMQYASKQKGKIANLNNLIDQLWTEGKTTINAGHGNTFIAIFTRVKTFLDVTLVCEEEPVGFISLKNEENGIYSIVTDTNINPHPAFTNNSGIGLEVMEKYRKRGIGSALLSLGLGLAQRHYKEKGTEQVFKVLATDISELGFGCYQNFGFYIAEGMRVSAGYYTEPDHVPEIKILRKKASKLGRLFKKLGY